VPLHSPSTTSDICLGKWLKGLTGVKYPDCGIVTANSDKVFEVWMALDASHTGVESGHPLDKDRMHAVVSNIPFVGDDRLLKTLPYIPYLKLEVVSPFERRSEGTFSVEMHTAPE
jgi:hypothetical protein